MKGHHWIKVGVVDVLVRDDGNRPVLLWFANPDRNDIPRPPDPDIVAITEETGWGISIERVWGHRGGFLWWVKCRAQLRTGVTNRSLKEIPQEWHNDRGNNDETRAVCEAAGLHASSGTYRLTADWDGFKRGTYLVWTHANGGGYLAIGEVMELASVVWLLLGELRDAPWSTPGGDS